MSFKNRVFLYLRHHRLISKSQVFTHNIKYWNRTRSKPSNIGYCIEYSLKTSQTCLGGSVPSKVFSIQESTLPRMWHFKVNLLLRLPKSAPSPMQFSTSPLSKLALFPSSLYMNRYNKFTGSTPLARLEHTSSTIIFLERIPVWISTFV